MVARVDALHQRGGPHGFGGIVGSIQVDPNAWFFKAHFLQDPVWPGSLGLEAFLQQDIGENVGYEDAVNQLRASFESRDTYA